MVKPDFKKLYRTLPDYIKTVLIQSNGWLVGGSINDILEDRPVNDWDIIVNPSDEDGWAFNLAMLSLKGNKISLNTYGGLKVTFENGDTLDIWPDTLDKFLCAATEFTYCLNLKRQKLISNAKD